MSKFEESTGEEWKGEVDFQSAFEKILQELHEALTDPEKEREFRQRDVNAGLLFSLDGETVKKITDIDEIPAAFNMKNRRLALDKLGEGNGVSTVFLVMDHNHGDSKTPVLFETMVMYKGEEIGMYRYSSVEQALTGHREALEALKIAIKNNI